MKLIRLDGPADVAGFRRAARASIAAGIEPAALRFSDGVAAELALDDGAAAPLRDGAHGAIALPAGFVTLCEQAGLHDDPSRYDRLYELAWRVAQRRSVWADTLDPQRVRLERMAHAVRREIHKAHAFVRFRPVGSAGDGALEHVAWFEPSHHIVQAMAPFFVRRFASMRWAILTPRGSLRWDGRRLETGPPASPRDAPGPDAGEALWLAYYRSIFNPARTMPQAMRREMPVRFWRNLPEAQQIDTLIDTAPGRTAAMLEPERARPSARRRGVAPAVAARACERCAFAAHATQMVWGEGASPATLMLVGEQPGDREDLEGRPFVGPAGQLVRDAIESLGWPADRLYLTNAVKHFKYELRGKRRMHKTAGQLEALACLEWLEQEIEVAQPRAIVALGATAARSLLGRPVAVNEHAGSWFDRADGRAVLVTWHPAALLRTVSPALRDAMHAQWLDHLRSASRFVEPGDASSAAHSR